MGYDLIVFLTLCYSAFRGAQKGFVWQVAAILALVVCFGTSGTLSARLAPLMPGEPPLNRWIAMFVLYLGFSFVAFGVARQLRGWMEKVRFVEYDKHLGAVFGFLKGGIFALVVTFFAVTLSGSLRETVMHSNTGYLSAVLLERVNPLLSADMRQALAPYTRGLDRQELDQLYAQQVNDAKQAAANGTGNAAPPKVPLIAEFLANLPKTFTEADKKLAATALQNTHQENRKELMEELQETTKPEEFRTLSREWSNGRPKNFRSRRFRQGRRNPGDNEPLGGENPSYSRSNPPRDDLNGVPRSPNDDPFGENPPNGLSQTSGQGTRRPPSDSSRNLNEPPPLPDGRNTRPRSDAPARFPGESPRWAPPANDPYDPYARDQVTDPFGDDAYYNDPYDRSDIKQAPPQTAPRNQPVADNRQVLDLIAGIAIEYASDDDSQRLMRDEISRSLTGLPPTVVLAVLLDWNADLQGLRPDPDPATNYKTALDIRVTRQLAAAKVPVSSLDEPLQRRVQQAGRVQDESRR